MQALQYKAVLGSTLCMLCSKSSNGKFLVQALQYKAVLSGIGASFAVQV